MTELAFHFNVPDSLVYACRFLRKAVAQGARVIVTGPYTVLKVLDDQLWTFSDVEFISHCFSDRDATMVRASAVVLDAELTQPAHTQVLLNLGLQVPVGFERFERVIEIVSSNEAQRQAARQRWKHYTSLGYPIQRHDLSAPEAN